MSAITLLLEKLILKGQASYNVFNHAFGGFGAIPLPPDQVAIITQIEFTPFINPIKSLGMAPPMTYGEFFNYFEYQLKIDGKKSKNYHIYRNPFNWKLTDNTFNFSMADEIVRDDLKNKFCFIASPPIQTETYQVCEERINLTISRNSMVYRMDDSLTYGPLNAAANEQNVPNGVYNMSTINRLNMFDINLNQQNYYPPSIQNAFAPLIPGAVQNYYQSNRVQTPQSFNSQISNIQDLEDVFHPFLYPINPLISFPLVKIGYVLVNKNAFDELINTN